MKLEQLFRNHAVKFTAAANLKKARGAMRVESRLGRVITVLSVVVTIVFLIMVGIVQMCTSRDVGVSSIARACETPTPPEPTPTPTPTYNGEWVVSDEAGGAGTCYLQPDSDEGMYTRALGPDLAWPDDLWATVSNEGSYNCNARTAYARMGYNGSRNPLNPENLTNRNIGASYHQGVVELLEIDPAVVRPVWGGWAKCGVTTDTLAKWDIDWGPTFNDLNHPGEDPELVPKENVKLVHWVGDLPARPINFKVSYSLYTWGRITFDHYDDFGYDIQGYAELVLDNKIMFKSGNDDWTTKTQVHVHMSYDGRAYASGGWKNYGHKDMLTTNSLEYKGDSLLAASGYIINTTEANLQRPSTWYLNAPMYFGQSYNNDGYLLSEAPFDIYWLNDDPNVEAWHDTLSFPFNYVGDDDYVYTEITNDPATGVNLGGTGPTQFRFKSSRQVGIGIHMVGDDRSWWGNISAAGGGGQIFDWQID